MGIFPIYYSVMSRTVTQSPPASVPGATPLLSADAVADVFRRLLQSVLRLAVKAGLRYAELDVILREELLRIAQEEIDPAQRANASKLSVMTGLHRKFVATHLSEASNRSQSTAPRSETAISQVFQRWAHEARRKPAMKRLRIADSPRKASFTELARSLVSDVHPRTILDELVRLGLVHEADGYVELLADSFTPKGRSDALLGLMKDNASAMLDTSVSNILAIRPLQLEQSIWGLGITLESAQAIANVAAEGWRESHSKLFHAISDAPEAPKGESTYRIRVGMYVNYEAHSATST